MKKIVYLLFGFSLLYGSNTNAQTFNTYSGANDTARGYLTAGNTDVSVDNPITAVSGTVYIKTTILSISVPSGVDPQFCDNQTCNTVALYDVFRSNAYPSTIVGNGSSNLYHALFIGMNNAPSGSTAVMNVRAQDTVAGYSRNLTFIAYKNALGIVKSQVIQNNDVVVYPNPAHNVVNIIYNEVAGVKKIAVYNLIGKMMKSFIPMDNNSAMLDIENIPTGVYFIRLMDSQNRVVSTKRFTVNN